MPEIGSITVWLELLKQGDFSESVERLWHVYFSRLVQLIRFRLVSQPPGGPDAEDLSLSAFHSVVQGIAAGRFPRMNSRRDLWQVLFMVASRKIADLHERDARLKRGRGRPVENLGDEDQTASLSREPDPAEAAVMAEEIERLLALLPDPTLRQIALWKMEGFTHAEIAHKLERSEPTVERKVRLIRTIWESAPDACLIPRDT